MEFIAEGFRALERHWRIVGAYVVLTLAVVMSIHFWQYASLHDLFGDLDDRTTELIDLAVNIIGTAISAALQAIFFGYLGKVIDRPLYKLDGAGEAIRRFFVMWLLLNMVMLAISEFTNRLMIDEHPAAMGVLTILVVWYVVYLPVGASIMFHGSAKREELSEALAPISRMFPQVILVLLLRMAEVLLLLTFGAAAIPTEEVSFMWVPGALALTTMLVLLECVSFAAMWEICRVHRDTDDEDDEFDF